MTNLDEINNFVITYKKNEFRCDLQAKSLVLQRARASLRANAVVDRRQKGLAGGTAKVRRGGGKERRVEGR